MNQAPLFQESGAEIRPLKPTSHLFSMLDKKGERLALVDALHHGHETHVPIVHFVGPLEGDLTDGMIEGHSKRLKDMVKDRFVYVDFVRASAAQPVKAKNQNVASAKLIDALFAAYRKHGVRFIPVHPVLEPSARRSAVKQSRTQDCRGVALRVRMNGTIFQPGRTLCSVLEDELTRLDATSEESDIFLDFAFIDEEQEFDPEDVAKHVTALRAAGQWRSIALLGTSMPKALGVVSEGTVGEIVRQERELWQGMHAHGVRDVVFGDYGIQHPDPPLEKIDGPVMRANVRYTIDGKFLVARGHGALGLEDPAEQYVECCQMLRGRSEFQGYGHSTSDDEIERCASKERVLTSQTDWRRVGTSRHLHVVREEVKQ